jgi:hypothetical protein
MNITLAVCDREAEYANHLMEYIKRKQKKQLQVCVFTNIDSLREYLKRDTLHILLIQEELAEENFNHDNIKHICVLSETDYSESKDKEPVIYKYQSAEIVLKELFGIFPPINTQARISNPSGRNTEIVSIFTAGDEVVSQLFAYSLAKQYSLLKRTLYINLNIFPVLSGISGHKTDKGLSEFIYFLKQNNPNLVNKMYGNITNHGTLAYMEGVTFGPDLYELTPEDVGQWLNAILQNTDYEVILFDVGSYTQACLEVFRNSSRLLLLSEEGYWEQWKTGNFKEQLEWSGNEEIAEKLILVPVTAEIKVKLHAVAAEDFEFETTNFSLAAEYIIK